MAVQQSERYPSRTIARALTIGPLVLSLLAIFVCSSVVEAETYRVGSGEKCARVSDIAPRLHAGDTVLVIGDIMDSIELVGNGTSNKPITIRGVGRIENGRLVRPRLMFAKDAPWNIMCRGGWNVIEGLDISGALSTRSFTEGSAVYCAADELTVRNCRIHNNMQGIYGDGRNSGNVRIEFCEFDSNGGIDIHGALMHSVYLCSTKPLATAIIENCYFHNATGGSLLKSRCPRNVIRYNWFEDAYYACLVGVGPAKPASPVDLRDEAYPMHTDIVGNVCFQGWSPGSRYPIASLGGEGTSTPGTEGDFNIAHNLFIATNGGVSPAVALLANGNVDHVRAYNNVFMEYGTRGFELYLRGNTWDGARTQAFVKRRAGTPEPVIDGASNWVSMKAAGVPEPFKNTLRGLNPKFVDLLNGDYRPRKDSPLAGAGMWPLPKGRIVDLVPEYEPQRGIPADLRPRPRRKVTPPSIGPFEVGE